jgi:hypothetical protein
MSCEPTAPGDRCIGVVPEAGIGRTNHLSLSGSVSWNALNESAASGGDGFRRNQSV